MYTVVVATVGVTVGNDCSGGHSGCHSGNDCSGCHSGCHSGVTVGITAVRDHSGVTVGITAVRDTPTRTTVVPHTTHHPTTPLTPGTPPRAPPRSAVSPCPCTSPFATVARPGMSVLPKCVTNGCWEIWLGAGQTAVTNTGHGTGLETVGRD